MGKEKGQRGGKTNVRHKFYVKGLRQTPNIVVSYREKQFSLQVVYNSLLAPTLPKGCFNVGQNYSAEQLTLSTSFAFVLNENTLCENCYQCINYRMGGGWRL